MDNRQFPQGDDILPQDPSPVPTDADLPEEPEIQALSFTPEGEDMTPTSEAVEEPASPLPEEANTEEVPMFRTEPVLEEVPLFPEMPAWEDASALPEADSSAPEVPEAAGPSFMERIPDVEDPEAAPSPLREEVLEAPVIGVPLTSDEDALNFHGMLHHGEEEPPFDPAILEDLNELPEAAEASVLPGEPEAEEEALSLLPEEPPTEPAYPDHNEAPEAIVEPPEPQPPVHSRPVRKGRPKRKKGEGLLGIPNILATVVWLALILAIGVTAGRMLWVCAADVLAFGRENKPITVTIYEADDMASITDKLYDAGLIRYKSLFQLYASISDAEEKIRPGIYDLNTLYDYHALVNFMTPRSSREVIELTIPEGYTCRQIFDLLEENRVCTAVDAAAYAADGELKDYWFLENVPRGDKYCLEGYLFPDTYEFYKNSTPREALERMLNNFEYRFSEEMRAQIDTLNENVTGGTFTVREVTIVASLIEKESAAPAESPSIAGVIYNRLFNWEGTPAYLNIDAAIVYAQDGNAETIDTSLDSPYNTYTHTGLTPTPISNPGLASLQAALSPESHNYYYYVLNPSTGMHQFATTQEEHNANIAAFYG